MIIIEKNKGLKIPYEVTGNSITFNNALSLNLSAYERDDDVHIDICETVNGMLVTGVIPGFATKYVAEIDIPAKEHKTAVTVDTETDEEQEIVTVIPFSIENVTVALWGNE